MIELTEPRWDLLDFPVRLCPVLTEVELEALVLVPGQRAVYREDTGRVLDLVSDRYRLIPHGDVFRAVAQAAEETPWPVRSVRTRVGAGGGYASVEWTFDHVVEVAPGDTVAVSLLAANSLDRSAALSLTLSARRLLCTNGLRGPRPEHRARWTHRRATVDLDRVRSWTRVLPDRAASMVSTWRAWTGRRIYATRLREWLEEDTGASSAIGERDRERVMRRLERRADGQPTVTLWEAYNALTWHATHGVRTRKAELRPLREEEVQRLALRFTEHATES